MDPAGNNQVDFAKYPTAQKLVAICKQFFSEVDNLYAITHSHSLLPNKCRTPGKALEEKLNREYGPGNPLYDTMCACVRTGLKEGWVATMQLDGPKYRRSKILLPSAQTEYFSITTVYMDSQDEYSGQYHVHPYGEINCVVQLDKGSELKGMQGWQG
jgi:hypothetical protein